MHCSEAAEYSNRTLVARSRPELALAFFWQQQRVYSAVQLTGVSAPVLALVRGPPRGQGPALLKARTEGGAVAVDKRCCWRRKEQQACVC